MKYLLDVNVLLASIWSSHPNHQKAFSWLEGKNIVLCPLAELGFLRISTNRKAINAPMEKTRKLLEEFASERNVERISDDLSPLDSSPTASEEVTDLYLADLAAKHDCRLVTMDKGISHGSVELI